MTNKQIFKEAIEKAIKNGYKESIKDFEWAHERFENGSTILKAMEYYTLFSHDFAKAFFGEHIVCEICGDQGCFEHTPKDKQDGMPNYIYHLKEMVCCGWNGKDNIGMSYLKEPLKYIEEFL